MKKPSDCNCIEDVRAEIDALDEKIMELFGKRFKFVKEVVKYKSNDEASIIAPDRRAKVLARRRELAIQNGLDPDVFENMYAGLIKHFIEEELKIVNKDK